MTRPAQSGPIMDPHRSLFDIICGLLDAGFPVRVVGYVIEVLTVASTPGIHDRLFQQADLMSGLVGYVPPQDRETWDKALISVFETPPRYESWTLRSETRELPTFRE